MVGGQSIRAALIAFLRIERERTYSPRLINLTTFLRGWILEIISVCWTNGFVAIGRVHLDTLISELVFDYSTIGTPFCLCLRLLRLISLRVISACLCLPRLNAGVGRL